VAVAHTIIGLNEPALKQLTVIFDRIGIQGLSVDISKAPFISPDLIKSREWLVESGILFDPDLDKLKASIAQYAKTRDMILEDTDLFTEPAFGLGAKEIAVAFREDEEKAAEIRKRGREVDKRFQDSSLDPLNVWEISQRLTTNMTRMLACQLRDIENLDSCAVIPIEFSGLEQDDPRLTKHDVLRICLGALPVPGDDVPWEQLIEYRNDPDTQSSFRTIKEFLSNVARGAFKPVQIEETLEYLVNRFRRNLEAHRINAVTTGLFPYVVTTPEFLEMLAGVGPDWGTHALFSMDHCKLGLLEGESTSAGSFVAFLTELKVGSFGEGIGKASA
jgi:hypothetical protein